MMRRAAGLRLERMHTMRAGERDADKCIELNPAFAKGYSRKAHVQFFMKEYEKALATYEKGLTFDPDNHELKEGVLRCRQAINRFMSGLASEDEIKERQAKAMSDPEVWPLAPACMQAVHVARRQRAWCRQPAFERSSSS
jgi:tetratricopeptide (TPR) repeat protein